jgi:hypothetical protein
MGLGETMFESAINELEFDEDDIAIESYEFYKEEPGTGVITTEELFNKKDDKNAPSTTKGRITLLGLGFKIKFEDGSKVNATAKDIFSSPFMKAKIKEFNDYYIGKLKYRPFTGNDMKNVKLDVQQILRKIFQLNIMNKVGFKVIDGTGFYGLFSWMLGNVADKITDSPHRENGILKIIMDSFFFGTTASLLSSKANNSRLSAPYCIVYIKPGEEGKPDRVFVRRILVIGYITKSISGIQKRWGSGGKEIGDMK